MGNLTSDIRFALRQMSRHPVATAVSIVSLALGIGATLTLSSIGHQIIMNPVPGAHIDRLCAVVDGPVDSGRVTDSAYSELAAFRRSPLLRHAVGIATTDAGLTAGSIQGRAAVDLVSPGYFESLEVRPSLGSFPVAGSGRDDVAVLSHQMWTSRFGADSSIVGREIQLNGRRFTVVAVSGEGFRGLDLSRPTEIWLPLRAMPILASGWLEQLEWLSEEDDNIRWLEVLIEPRPGTSEASVLDELRRIRRELEPGEVSTVSVIPARELVSSELRDAGRFTLTMLAFVGLTFLIACANLVAIVIARLIGRDRELAIRRALGAGTFRLVRQIVTENLVLALMGGATSLLVARWVFVALNGITLPGGVEIATLDQSLGRPIVGLSFVLASAAGLVIGFLPSVIAARRPLVGGFSLQTRSSGPRRNWLRSLLLAAQVAIVVALLVGSGLFARSFLNGLRVNTGFDARSAGVVTVNLGEQRYDEERAHEFFTRLFSALSNRPEIAAVAIAQTVPVSPRGMSMTIVPPGMTSEDGPEVSFNVVSSDYFAAMGIPIVEGRPFDSRDTADSEGVVIVNRALANVFWPGRSAVGQALSSGDDDQPLRVVGIVPDGKYRSLSEDRLPYFYLPAEQAFGLVGLGNTKIVVRGSRSWSSAAIATTAAIRLLDPELPVGAATSLSDQVRSRLSVQRLGTIIFGLLASVAFLLSLVGIWGALNQSVAARGGEIALRMALGAANGRIIREIVRAGLSPVLVGVVVGLGVAAAGSRLLESFVFGVSTIDPLVFAGASFVVAVFALLVALPSAVRATRVNPATALREE